MGMPAAGWLLTLVCGALAVTSAVAVGVCFSFYVSGCSTIERAYRGDASFVASQLSSCNSGVLTAQVIEYISAGFTVLLLSFALAFLKYGQKWATYVAGVLSLLFVPCLFFIVAIQGLAGLMGNRHADTFLVYPQACQPSYPIEYNKDYTCYVCPDGTNSTVCMQLANSTMTRKNYNPQNFIYESDAEAGEKFGQRLNTLQNLIWSVDFLYLVFAVVSWVVGCFYQFRKVDAIDSPSVFVTSPSNSQYSVVNSQHSTADARNPLLGFQSGTQYNTQSKYSVV